MRTIALLITLLAAAPQATTDQKAPAPDGTVIASAEVTGFDINRLSPGLRDDIRRLAGTPLEKQRLDELAARIEAERPRYVAAVRTFMDPDGRAGVVFVMGRPGQSERDDNVNTRYIVEQADIHGVPDAEITDALRDDLQALVGKRLDSEEAERLQQHIEQQLSGYDLSRRIQRGTERGRIRLVYDARKREPPSWLRFEALRSNVVYHSEHGWGSYLDLGMDVRSIRFAPIVAINDSEDLIEEISGYGLRFETKRLGTRRLGASLEWSKFDQDWRGATIDAIALKPELPALYSERSTFTPQVKFALTPELSVAAGVSITELDPLDVDLAAGSRMANAAIASIDYTRRWGDDDAEVSHRVSASFGVRKGSSELESDLAYTRYFGQGWYRYDFGRHHVQVSGLAGGITGQAPLFERFSLGDSTKLLGWDKYEIAPAGGDRVIYGTVEYRYTGVALFFDVGSVWDAHTERRVRSSAGFGFHAGPAFFKVAFPLNTDDLTAIFAVGLRTSGVGIRW
jgi:hypothetical protein